MTDVIKACGARRSMESFGGLSALGGEVFYVYSSNEDTTIGSYMTNKFGSGNVFKATAATADVGIQAALDACVSSRGDYVVIMPSETDYDLTATLTLNKKAMHLICPSGLGNEVGATNAARLHQTAAVPVFTLTQSAIEIAGLYTKHYPQYSTCYAVANVANVGVYGCNIHNNTFIMRSTSASAQPMINFSGDAGAWGSIEKNWLIGAVSNATYTSAIQIGGSATSARVKYNEITIGDGCTLSIGILNAAVKGVTAFNVLSEAGGSGATSGGTITKGITIHASGAAIENRLAVVTSHGLSGGTADISYCDNKDGHNGGAVELEA